MKVLRNLFLFILLNAVPVLAASQDRNEFRWQGRIGDGKTLEIRGVNGDVRAEEAAGSEIEVVAVKRGRGSDLEAVKIEMVEHSDGITFCTSYLQRDGQWGKCGPGGGGRNHNNKNNTNISYTVRVPAGVHFNGHTVNGSVNIKELDGNVRATTVNGDVRVSTTGYAEARTVNGSINVACGRANWHDTLQFSTVNGSIEVALPAHTNAEFSASLVNGSITTDLPILLKGRVDKRQMNGTLGGGESSNRKLRMNTVNGSITVKSGRSAS